MVAKELLCSCGWLLSDLSSIYAVLDVVANCFLGVSWFLGFSGRLLSILSDF